MTLSPQHHLVIELKQQIAMLYDRNLNLLTNTAVHRKIQLHVEIMEVLAVIEPGLSRLQGNSQRYHHFIHFKIGLHISVLILILVFEVDTKLINK